MDVKDVMEYADKIGITAEQTIEVFKGLTDLGKEFINANVEIKRIDAEVERIKSIENVMIQRIKEQSKIYNQLLTGIFASRDKAIEKHFKVIDKGIKDNDREMILGGLYSLASVVKESPFADFEKFSIAFDSGNIII